MPNVGRGVAVSEVTQYYSRALSPYDDPYAKVQRGEGTCTRAHSGPGSGTSGWGGATSKACCKPSKGDSLAPSTQAAAAPRERPTREISAGGEVRARSRSGLPALGTPRTSPSRGGLLLGTRTRLTAVRETPANTETSSPRSTGEAREASASR